MSLRDDDDDDDDGDDDDDFTSSDTINVSSIFISYNLSLLI